MARKNKEADKAYWREYYRKNKDKLMESRKEYQREYHKEWQKKNKDKWNAYMREYRRKKRLKDLVEKSLEGGVDKAKKG